MLSRYYCPHVGGVERQVENISSILTKRGFDITVITEKYNEQLKFQETLGKVKIIRIQVIKLKLIGLLSIWINILKNIKIINDSDIVHVHDVFIWYLPFRFIFPQKKVFITFHGYETYPIKRRAILLRKISEIFSNGNICIGGFIEKWYGTKADIVSYPGIDLNKFKKSRKKHYEYDAIFAGRLDEQTGILTYLDSIKKLKKKGLNFKLLVIGEGKFNNETKKNSTLLGWKNNPEKYFKKARFAFVSRYLAILEAFAAKKLVFAVYDNPLKKDYLYMTPFKKWIVIAKNSDELCSKVECFIKDPAYERKLVKEAYNWVKNQTWEKLANHYIKLWS